MENISQQTLVLKIKGNTRHRSTVEVSACESFPHSAVIVAYHQTQNVKCIVDEFTCLTQGPSSRSLEKCEDKCDLGLQQGSSNCFCKGTDKKYFKLVS